MTQYRLEFEIIQTKYKSVGPWHHSKEVIESWVNYLNKTYYGDIQHWIGEK